MQFRHVVPILFLFAAGLSIELPGAVRLATADESTQAPPPVATPVPTPVPPPKPTSVSIAGTVLSTAGGAPKHAVVYLEGGQLSGQPPPTERPTISQRGARFRPEFLVITVGQTVNMPNDDRIVHNVFSVSPVKRFDLGHYPQGELRSVTFDKPGVIELYCNIHENMQAVVVVAPSKFYGQVGEDGRYSIPNVPPGKYRLVAYSPELGQESMQVDLQPGGPAEFALKLKGK